MFRGLFARRRTADEPFPAAWDAVIASNVVIAGRLATADRTRLRERVQAFVADKHWEGCGGLELSDEMIVTIAAQACILTLHRDDDLYRDVQSILAYPTTMIQPPRRLGMFEQPRAPIQHGSTILGEAHLHGPVILAWDAVLASAREEVPGNVVFHELAHKIDMASGSANGTPPLPRDELRRWAQVCTAAFRDLRARVDFGVPSALDPYAATNEAEFFAVATETYFLQPVELRADYPELFTVLQDFYKFW